MRATIWYNSGLVLYWRRVSIFILVSNSDCIFWSLPLHNCESKHYSAQKTQVYLWTFDWHHDVLYPTATWTTLPRVFLTLISKAGSRSPVLYHSSLIFISWGHWMNSAESQELYTAYTPPDCVPEQSLRAFLQWSVTGILYIKK